MANVSCPQRAPYLYPMGKYLLLGFVFYLLYKLVFDLILPVSKATAQVRSKMQEMQQEQLKQQQAHAAATAQPQKASPVSRKDEDYIDFEEVR
jgi:hypothetical protein